ncbi:hypothetical protein A2U01_0025617, partial [Trifolium medium]|nr:hypothetical protein [Trifolium medium]
MKGFAAALRLSLPQVPQLEPSFSSLAPPQ